MPKKPAPPPNKAEPDPAPQTFVEKVRAIVDQASFAYEEEAPQWPITRPRGAYSEVWVSELMKKLERVFDPDFHTCRPHPENIPDGEAQRIHDERIMAKQRKMANRLWREDREIATRIADILRKTEKPAGIPDVDSRVAFLREVDRLSEVKTSAKSAPTSTPSRIGYPRRIGIILVYDEKWSTIAIEGSKLVLEGIRPGMKAIVEAMDALGAIGVENSQPQKKIILRAGLKPGNTIRGVFSGSSEAPESKAALCADFGRSAIRSDPRRNGKYYIAPARAI
jgi:hypothetical protein